MTIHRHRDSNSPRPLHVIVKMKQYQQSYNSTPGPTTVDTHIKNQKSKEDHHTEVVEPDHVTSNHDTTFQPLPMSVINRVKVAMSDDIFRDALLTFQLQH